MLTTVALAAFVQMDCVDYTCAAVQDNGRVVVWGGYDPVRDLKSDTPREVPGLDEVRKVAAGNRFFVVLKRDGTVWSWGFNRSGVLGDHTGPGQTLRDTAVPVRVHGLTGVVDIEAGLDKAFAVRSDGTLWAWGNVGEGQLGIGLLNPAWVGMSVDQPFPAQVRGVSNAKQVSAGMYHTLILLRDGRVVACGSNQTGAVGDGTIENRWEPVEVKGVRDAVSVAAGLRTSLAVLKDGTVRVWGRNDTGVLLDGTRQGFSPDPRAVKGLATAADAVAGAGFFLVRLTDGTLRCWGHSSWGMCGDGKAGGYSMAMASPRGVTGVQWYGAGAYSAFAKLADGRLVGWGALFSEPMSDYTRHSSVPVEWTEDGWTRPKGRVAPPAR